MFEILIGIVVAALFVASFVWGSDSRIGFSDPRRREDGQFNRRGEFR